MAAKKTAAPTAPAAKKTKKHGTVIAGRLNVRKGAGLSSDIIKVIRKGTEVEISSTAKDAAGEPWYKITGGYVMAKWIEVKD